MSPDSLLWVLTQTPAGVAAFDRLMADLGQWLLEANLIAMEQASLPEFDAAVAAEIL